VVLWLSPALLVARFLVVLHLALTTRRRANLVVCACQLVPAQAVLLVLSGGALVRRRAARVGRRACLLVLRAAAAVGLSTWLAALLLRQALADGR
jgi:hypothetical protein